MLQAPESSPYDLKFPIFGFDVRVSWTFWLIAIVLGYNNATATDANYAYQNLDSPGPIALLAIWVAAMFVSILIHELGHTFAFRFYGIDSQIVLYHFGGLAIPTSFLSWNGAKTRRIAPLEQLIISAAGPAAQLVLGSIFLIGAISQDIKPAMIPNTLFGFSLISQDVPLPSNAALAMLLDSMIFINFMWSFLNLLPILPMDGGRIAESLIAMYRRGDALREASILSIACGCLFGWWLLNTSYSSTGIMLIVLGLSNIENLQRYSRW
ncbi:MAG: site-2 protease family protein [Pirellulales bacterium]